MSRTMEADAVRKGEQYLGSPAPFVFFLVLFLVFLALAIFSFPHPGMEPQGYTLPVLFIVIAFVSLMFLPATVAINKEWEEAIILVSGSFRGLQVLASSLSGPLQRVF